MSNNHQSQLEIQKQARDQQTKFVYYIIALCVAAIGFSVHQTVGHTLNWYHIILGCAIFSWVASIFCGFQFLQILMKVLIANNEYFDLIRGNVEGVPPGKLVDDVAKERMTEKAENYSVRSSKNFKWQQYWFYIGLFSFLGWHLTQMMSI
jgi:hypothetical protein